MAFSGPFPASDVTHPGGMAAKRVFPTDRRAHLDPFVVFERFFIDPDQGFETHSHRGFEIVSYMLDGAMAHADSMGHEAVAETGDAMRVTTGSGMEHSEMPARDTACSGLQLWINLPRDRKDVDPSYEDASAEDLSTTEDAGATVTTVVGEGSPIDLLTDVSYEVAAVTDTWTWTVPDGWNGVVYVIEGTGTVGGSLIDAADYGVVEDGGTVELAAEGGQSDDPLRVAAIAGSPHGEPIRQRGPFVE